VAATDDAAAAVAATLAIGIEVGAVTSDEATVLKSTTTTGRVSVLNEEDDHGKRKFFPRVKQLITNAHWEDFLTTVLQIVDRTGAPECAAASHKKDNAWVVAFADIYAGVARDYSVPQGKNRYHKFKDKIVEVWQALEQLQPGEHSCRVRAIRQLHRHRLAVADHATERHWERQQQQLLHPTSSSTGLVLGSGADDDNPHSPKKQKRAGPGRPPGSTAAAIHAAALAKLAASAEGSSGSSGRGGANHKRSFGTARLGGGSSTVAHAGLVPQTTSLSAGVGSLTWQNLEETVCLARLPEPLRSLVHFKQLSREMAARTFNRGTRKAIEVHGKTVDTAYLSALQLYIDADATPGKLQTTTQQQQQQQKDGAAEEDTFEDAKEKDEDDNDVDGDADPEEVEATHAQRANDLFHRAQTMAFLYRYASSLEEQRVLNEEYRKHTAHYILHITRTRGGDEDVVEDAHEEEATADNDDNDNGTSMLTHDAATEAAAIAAAAATATVSVPDTHDTMDVDGTTPTAADAGTETETYSYTV